VNVPVWHGVSAGWVMENKPALVHDDNETESETVGGISDDD
jgi:hypothetical protein